ncbi:hypothetical protein [Bradyrhizobium centrolobii]|uniref:hypothetical protein n=1 Tax=Bradyrhizobium centrolobii TaxID=1505087 RepID=UPI0010A95020|nr:hypothetical protein [Bradyrhizobium centrolobii]
MSPDIAYHAPPDRRDLLDVSFSPFEAQILSLELFGTDNRYAELTGGEEPNERNRSRVRRDDERAQWQARA